jgi:hypothetical protein
MTDTQFGWYIFVHSIAAAGTVGTVLVALFGTWIKAKCWPPKLDVTLPDPSGERTSIKRKDPDGTVREDITRWYHVRVENQRRLSPATNLSLHLVAIEEPGLDNTLEKTWQGNVEIPWRHRSYYPDAQRIVGKSIDYDLCTLGRAGVMIYPIAAPSSFKRLWGEKCRLFARLEIHSSEIDVPIRVQISWDGIWDSTWDEKKVREHFLVRREFTDVA